MNFSRFLDIQSWWEVPSIAYFCSLFRTAFNLLDFDIEELEEALLNDGTEESASSLLTELIVRLLNGCLGNNDISAFNYQMYLRRLFRRKCQESNRYNPFNTDIDFQFLPLRTKVEILYALCDFRLDAEDVFDLFKNLEAESLRVEPLGFDNNDSAYWYFYGTRLYREDIVEKTKGKGKKRKHRERGRHGWLYGVDLLDEEETDRVWQVVCFTEEDWTHLTDKFKSSSSKVEKELYRSLSENFLPEIPKLFQEKERLQRKRLLELLPRRTSNRMVQKIKQKEDESNKNTTDDEDTKTDSIENHSLARINRAKRRRLLRDKSKSPSTASSSEEESNKTIMPEKAKKRKRSHGKKPKNSATSDKGEPPPEPPAKPGRKTNNSLSSATGQIVISDNEEPINSTRKKLKTSQIFSQTEEDIQTDMYKVLEQVSAHEDAWPFLEPVEEEYAPNYYAVIRRPMDLHKMEERLDNGYYTEFSMFQSDFKLIVNNCRLYNGQDNEYTTMVDKLQVAFDRLTEKYIHRISSSDEEIAVEFPLPTPSRKHKLKSIESPEKHKKKKRKSHDEPGTSKEDPYINEEIEEVKLPEVNKIEQLPEGNESQKHKEGKSRKKKKSHHRHGKHSKSNKGHSEHKSKSSKHGKRKHGRESKKHGKGKKKKNKHIEPVINPVIEPVIEPEQVIIPLTRTLSQESLDSSNGSRSASPLPSIHTLTPSPTPDLEQPPDLEFYKDKFDKIKERRRTAVKDAWESLFEPKPQIIEKQKPNTTDKVKNKKLRDTIERLKAKNEKYKESSLFNSLLSSNSQGNSDSNLTIQSSTKDEDDDSSDETFNPNPKEKKIKESINNSNKGVKKNTAKNESASEALEQVVKDISMLLDESPKAQILSPLCLSPIQILSTDDNSRQDDESSQTEKVIQKPRKRAVSKEPKIFKRREIQRTIDRLQPGKSKGNLLTNIAAVQKIEETVLQGVTSKVREINKNEEPSPKLSLGSVLPTVEFSLGNDHNFGNQDENKDIKGDSIQKDIEITDNNNEKKPVPPVNTEKLPIEKEHFEKPEIQPADFKSKTLPNLSAWLKAFGARKSTMPATLMKKKIDEREDNKGETNTIDTKTVSPKNAKFDSPTGEISPNPEGGESPLPNMNNTPKHRRTSTGSSISERSSFSQDLDSPRHQMSHTSPLLRSPASPRIDEFQKITYPIINGTVRAGFYHDTISMKSSPDKSCSPREGPQSPYSSYSPYSPHVYASNNVMGAAPNYLFDHNKSPIPTYGQNQQPPPYYDSSKSAAINRQRTHEDYTFGPDNPHNQFRKNFSTPASTYNQTATSTYPHVQVSSMSKVSTVPTTSNCPQGLSDPKNAAFPVKKRTYAENDLPPNNKKVSEEKDTNLNKRDYTTKVEQTLRPMSNNSVDSIAIALSEKSELAKLNSLREKSTNYVDRQHGIDIRENSGVNSNEHPIEMKKDLPISTVSKITNMSLTNKDNIDMINMGYTNTDTERRNGDINELNEFVAQRELTKTNIPLQQNKGYEVDAIAMNLGMNNQQQQQKSNKSNLSTILSTDKTNIGVCFSSGLSDYEAMALGNQNVNNFSMNDIEIANKKLYSNNPVAAATTGLDYGNWKINNQIRKPDVLPSDYSNSSYTPTINDKLKPDNVSSTASSVNYSKTIQQQYHNYSPSRTSTQSRAQEMSALQSELRIPNPRGHIKNDSMSNQIDPNMLGKTVENLKTQKSEQLIQNHPLVNSLSYKTSYPSNSQLQLESLRNLQNIPQMLERYTNDERYLSSLSSFPTAGASSLYHDKSFQMAQMSQMFKQSVSNDVHPVTSSLSIYSQPTISKDTNIYKNPANIQASSHDLKSKTKRKRSGETKQSQLHANQSFHTSCTTDVLSSVKSSMVPGSAFNFGAPQNMALGGGFYSDNTGFSIEDFRNSTNQLMAANYVAAVAHQRNNAEANVEKMVKPAHQNSSHPTTSAFPFMSHSQVRASYPFVGADPSSPLYQQYLQRQQEELIRQTGAHTIMGLYPPGYPSSLQARQPYDAINRPSWI